MGSNGIFNLTLFECIRKKLFIFDANTYQVEGSIDGCRCKIIVTKSQCEYMINYTYSDKEVKNIITDKLLVTLILHLIQLFNTDIQPIEYDSEIDYTNFKHQNLTDYEFYLIILFLLNVNTATIGGKLISYSVCHEEKIYMMTVENDILKYCFPHILYEEFKDKLQH